MPEMRFVVLWPDGRKERCYSPSSVVTEYLEVGVAYPLAEFAQRADDALAMANERVRARYGMGCAQAMNQAATIADTVKRLAHLPDAQVRIEQFEP